MTMASLELCKELLELSGWGNNLGGLEVAFSYMGYDDDYSVVNSLVALGGGYFERIPAYDLGYLLRKLPRYIKYPAEPVKYRPLLKVEDDTYTIGYVFAGWKVFAEADTPEDAAAKLAIQLFKQGILK